MMSMLFPIRCAPGAAVARRRQRGGFLLEISLVLLAVGVLTVSTFEVHSAMRKRQQNTEARNVLMSVDAALRTFIIREHRLPCPAVDGGDVEKAGSTGGCVASVGDIPFASLGLENPRLTVRYGLNPVLVDPTEPELMARAETASRVAGSMAVPYVAGRDARQLFGACDQVALNPAYVLMWMSGSAEDTGSPAPELCFRESADQSMGFLSMSGHEFLGWLQIGLRP